jgi:transposase
MLVVSNAMSKETGTVLDSDVLYGFRLRLFDHARVVGVSRACRTFGIHRSTYYRWKATVERSGIGMLRPRERRSPRMPNQTSPVIEARILAFAIAHPGLGPRRISATLVQERWGGIAISHTGVWRILRRHGLSRRVARLSLVAGYAAVSGRDVPRPESERSPRPSGASDRGGRDGGAAHGWEPGGGHRGHPEAIGSDDRRHQRRRGEPARLHGGGIGTRP